MMAHMRELRVRLVVDDSEKTKFGQFSAAAARAAQTLDSQYGSALSRATDMLDRMGTKITIVGLLLARSLVNAFSAVSSSVRTLGQEFVDINEKFSSFQITLGSALRSLSAAGRIINEIVKITAQSPVPFQDLIQTVQGVSVIPQTSAMLGKQVAGNNLSDPNGFLRKTLRTVEAMVTFRPDKNASDAVYSIREALGGQMRSLIRRFDVPLTLLSQMSGNSLSKLKADPEKMMEALSMMFTGIITPDAVVQMARQPSKLLENYREQLFTIPLLRLGQGAGTTGGLYNKSLVGAQENYDKLMRFMWVQKTQNRNERGELVDGEDIAGTGVFEKRYLPRISAALEKVFDSVSSLVLKLIDKLADAMGVKGVDRFEKVAGILTMSIENVTSFITRMAGKLDGFDILGTVDKLSSTAEGIFGFLSGIFKAANTVLGSVGTGVAVLTAPMWLPHIGSIFSLFRNILKGLTEIHPWLSRAGSLGETAKSLGGKGGVSLGSRLLSQSAFVSPAQMKQFWQPGTRYTQDIVDQYRGILSSNPALWMSSGIMTREMYAQQSPGKNYDKYSNAKIRQLLYKDSAWIQANPDIAQQFIGAGQGSRLVGSSMAAEAEASYLAANRKGRFSTLKNVGKLAGMAAIGAVEIAAPLLAIEGASLLYEALTDNTRITENLTKATTELQVEMSRRGTSSVTGTLADQSRSAQAAAFWGNIDLKKLEEGDTRSYTERFLRTGLRANAALLTGGVSLLGSLSPSDPYENLVVNKLTDSASSKLDVRAGEGGFAKLRATTIEALKGADKDFFRKAGDRGTLIDAISDPDSVKAAKDFSVKLRLLGYSAGNLRQLFDQQATQVQQNLERTEWSKFAKQNGGDEGVPFALAQLRAKEVSSLSIEDLNAMLDRMGAGAKRDWARGTMSYRPGTSMDELSQALQNANSLRRSTGFSDLIDSLETYRSSNTPYAESTETLKKLFADSKKQLEALNSFDVEEIFAQASKRGRAIYSAAQEQYAASGQEADLEALRTAGRLFADADTPGSLAYRKRAALHLKSAQEADANMSTGVSSQVGFDMFIGAFSKYSEVISNSESLPSTIAQAYKGVSAIAKVLDENGVAGAFTKALGDIAPAYSSQADSLTRQQELNERINKASETYLSTLSENNPIAAELGEKTRATISALNSLADKYRAALAGLSGDYVKSWGSAGNKFINLPGLEASVGRAASEQTADRLRRLGGTTDIAQAARLNNRYVSEGEGYKNNLTALRATVVAYGDYAGNVEKVRAINAEINDLLVQQAQYARHHTFGTAMEDALDNLSGKYREAASDWYGMVTQAGDAMQSSMAGAFHNMVMGTESVSEAFRSMATNILSSMAQIASNQVASGILSYAFAAIGGALFPAMTTTGAASLSNTSGGVDLGNYSQFDTNYGNFGMKAAGGMIVGGSGVKDDRPIVAMGGEFVIRKDAAMEFGYDNLERINRREFGRYASGGVVGNYATLQRPTGNIYSPTNVTLSMHFGKGSNEDDDTGNFSEQLNKNPELAKMFSQAVEIKVHETIIEFQRQGIIPTR